MAPCPVRYTSSPTTQLCQPAVHQQALPCTCCSVSVGTAADPASLHGALRHTERTLYACARHGDAMRAGRPAHASAQACRQAARGSWRDPLQALDQGGGCRLLGGRSSRGIPHSKLGSLVCVPGQCLGCSWAGGQGSHQHGVVVAQLARLEVDQRAGPVIAQVHGHDDAVHLQDGLGRLAHPRQGFGPFRV